MKQFVTPYNGNHKVKGEVITMKSATLPDEALSMRQIFEKFANGSPLEGKEEIYFEDNVYQNVEKMDLADVERLKDAYKEQQQEAEQKLDAIAAKRKRDKLKESIKKEQEQEVKKQEESKPESSQ